MGKFQHIDKMLRRIRGPVRAQPVNGIFSLRALAVQKLRLVYDILGGQPAEKPDVRARSQESQDAVTNQMAKQ